MRRSLSIICDLLVLGVISVLAYLPLLLFVHAETTGGRLAGAGSLLIVVTLVALHFLQYPRYRKIALCMSGVFFFVAVLCLSGACWISPSGRLPPGNFSQHFSGEIGFRRAGLANIVPEIDQLKLGTYIIGHADSLMNKQQSERLRRLVVEVYTEMQKDPAFGEAGSALGMCYEDMFLGKCTTLHFYEYVPRQLEKAPYPVIVFLHGSFGNFRGYMWVLRELSDAAGVAIVAPTYGSGNWCLDSDSSVLKTLHDYFLSNPEFDKKRMYLAGLSNGGAGVTRGIRNVGRDYRGFILISPVIEPEIISSEGFAENLKGKPVLIIHGENDPRIPARIVRLREALMKTRIPEVSLRSHYYKEEDHFLMFSQRALLTRDISTWLRETAGLND